MGKSSVVVFGGRHAPSECVSAASLKVWKEQDERGSFWLLLKLAQACAVSRHFPNLFMVLV